LQPHSNAKNKAFYPSLLLSLSSKPRKTLLVKEFRIVLDYSLLHFDRTCGIGVTRVCLENFYWQVEAGTKQQQWACAGRQSEGSVNVFLFQCNLTVAEGIRV
jgi:hypothetical protein